MSLATDWLSHFPVQLGLEPDARAYLYRTRVHLLKFEILHARMARELSAIANRHLSQAEQDLRKFTVESASVEVRHVHWCQLKRSYPVRSRFSRERLHKGAKLTRGHPNL
jgi:hypothetical protein